MKNKQLKAILLDQGACLRARMWVGRKSAEEAWAKCPNGSWMAWSFTSTEEYWKLFDKIKAKYGLRAHQIINTHDTFTQEELADIADMIREEYPTPPYELLIQEQDNGN